MGYRYQFSIVIMTKCFRIIWFVFFLVRLNGNPLPWRKRRLKGRSPDRP
jgi:hypothetical protein